MGGGGRRGRRKRASCMSLSLGEVVLVLKTRLDLLPAPSQCFQPNYSGVNQNTSMQNALHSIGAVLYRFDNEKQYYYIIIMITSESY